MKAKAYVYLAYYHNGWFNEPWELIGVCDSRRTANAVIRQHKVAGYRGFECTDLAKWSVKRAAVRTGGKQS